MDWTEYLPEEKKCHIIESSSSEKLCRISNLDQLKPLPKQSRVNCSPKSKSQILTIPSIFQGNPMLIHPYINFLELNSKTTSHKSLVLPKPKFWSISTLHLYPILTILTAHNNPFQKEGIPYTCLHITWEGPPPIIEQKNLYDYTAEFCPQQNKLPWSEE
jgi:hypothetical protein